jgi:hypothetical protein
MGVSEFIGLTELLSIQYLTNIFPLTLPSPLGGEGRVRGTFHGCHGKRDGYT